MCMPEAEERAPAAEAFIGAAAVACGHAEAAVAAVLVAAVVVVAAADGDPTLGSSTA
jgi:hypothetical protein